MLARAAVVVGFALAAACDDVAGSGNEPSDAAGAGAAGARPADASAAGAPLCDARTEVFPVLCATAICHEGTLNGLDLLAPGVDERVLDVPARGNHCASSGLRIVDSQQPARSLLLLKLSEQPPCGSPMPLGSGPAGLTARQRACLDDYVAALAGTRPGR